MKRFLIILCCICLIICLAAPALAYNWKEYFWEDYVVSSDPGFDYDSFDVFIPASACSPRWVVTGQTLSGESVTLSVLNEGYINVNFSPFTPRGDVISLDGIDLQSELTIYLDLHQVSEYKRNYISRFDCINEDGYSIKTINSKVQDFENDFGTIVFDLSEIPEGTVGIKPDIYTQYWFPADAVGDYTFSFVGLSFDVLQPPSMTGSYEFMQLQNYIVNESSDGDTSKLYCSIPFSDFNTVTWYKLQGEDQQRVQSGMGQSFTTVLEEDPYGWWIDCSPFSGRQYIDITDVVNGSTFSVSFDITYAEEYPQQLPGMAGRYQVRYYDKDFNLIGDVQFFDMEEVYWDLNELSFTIDKPENAVGMSFILQFTNVNSLSYPNAITLDFHSVDLVCDIPTMVRVQQETGRTNQLLESFMNYKPLPDLPPWNDSMHDAINKEDSLVDMFNNGTLENFGSQIADVTDQLLMYSAAFTLWFLIWDRICDIPWINTLLICSLALGLLGAFLGMGLAAGRAASRSEGRSRKKGS